MKPLSLHPIWRLCDALLTPVMYLGAGTWREKPQETHKWHIQTLDPNLAETLSPEMMAAVTSSDPSNKQPGRGLLWLPRVLFHLPLFGGWRHYVVLEIETNVERWNIGWMTKMHNTNEIIRFDIHKLPLTAPRVRMLRGLQDRTTYFFAVTETGAQIPLSVVGEGAVGTPGPYTNIRLL